MAELIEIDFEDSLNSKGDASVTRRDDIFSFGDDMTVRASSHSDEVATTSNRVSASQGDANTTPSSLNVPTTASQTDDARIIAASPNGDASTTTSTSREVDDFSVTLAATYLDDALQNRHIDFKY